MAVDHPIDTDDGAIPRAVRRFLRNRLFELFGFGLFSAGAAAGVALATWSPADPSLNRAIGGPVANLLGYAGAVIADELMQFLGLASIAAVAVPLAWSARLMSHDPIPRPVKSVLGWMATVLAAAGFLALLPSPHSWPLEAGLGGQAGDVLRDALLSVLALGLKNLFATFVAAMMLAGTAILSATVATGIGRSETSLITRVFGETVSEAMLSLTGAIQHAYLGWRARAALKRALRPAPAPQPEPAGESRFIRLAGIVGAILHSRRRDSSGRIEPVLGRRPGRNEPWLKLPAHQEPEEAQVGRDATPDPDEEGEDDEGAASPRIEPRTTAISQAKVKRRKADSFEFPALTLLAEPKKSNRGAELSEEALEQNARALEGVLEDFGVKGQIINVRPGPVVTLYELEPAPGIKSSRVISLADDIARSMSAVACRVAVVSGRNVIGIELPNSKRETVYLRELLGSEVFEKTTLNLALALGKNIGGEPVFADLARMPHLLIAGTTGSGKSVGINTMILSLLYRLPPDRCKLIMIDPKMLELSVYEGIPHLLSPVVTDPRKAVVALKWAVREMEDRYRKMSKVAVRNIDGFNARLEQAARKGQAVTRTVQTGFDPETGEPIFEKEEMSLQPMPYIVVIIDEMADLMMVAGKDIEGAVQRLAQMARAAGIHVVMATQRPSVDVITGTIKANFPTRISFQVTSKIDSRTILGEQGAEQLLGQGDMLYMVGGGRIGRLHGPFVSDDEVEKVVKFLKSQGSPEYVDAVTEEEPEDGAYGEGPLGDDEAGGGSGDDLYDQAVAVVLRDKKVSTSYIQRRLQVGYNKAASLIERMEKEGLISQANATGKREILVPGDSARA
ncbi:MAG: DNA translocase FtsK 4TM domain-containing protein [Hyphomicrobiales bacterium]